MTQTKGLKFNSAEYNEYKKIDVDKKFNYPKEKTKKIDWDKKFTPEWALHIPISRIIYE